MSDNQPAWMLSSSPHVHSGDSVQRIMADVLIALLPAVGVSVYFFGLHAVRLLAVCVAACVVSEFAARRIMRRASSLGDLSAVVTGVLLAMNLPPGLPSWMAIVGSVAAIVLAKQLFGGLGYNPFNPALVGRVFLLISFPVAMTTWLAPGSFLGADAVTTATPLGAWKTALSAGGAPPDFAATHGLRDLFVGRQAGCIGETSEIALLLGAAYLLARRVIAWQVPVFYLGTVAVFTAILYATDHATNLSPAFHLATGGVVLGACFMATDMVTTPITRKGLAVFGVGCGVLTVLIRKWGGYPEGVSFAILVMNAFTPLIDRFTRPRVFGRPKATA